MKKIDESKLHETRKQLMATWLLMEQDDAFLPSGSVFFKRLGTAVGDIGRSFKKGIKDVISSTWGVLGTIFTLDNKKAQERYRAAKRRSERFAAEYRETENRINSILNEPGSMLFLSAILPTGVVSTELILKNAYREISSFGSGVPLTDRLDAWSARWNDSVSVGGAAAGGAIAGGMAGRTKNELINDLKKLFYGDELKEARSIYYFLLSEQKKEQKEEFKTELIQSIKGAFNNIRGFLISATHSLELIEQNIEKYNAVVSEKKKTKQNSSEQKIFEQVDKKQQEFINGMLQEFQKDYLEPLKSKFFWMSNDIGKINLDGKLESIKKSKEILQNILKGISS